jgi:hypothetical protein
LTTRISRRRVKAMTADFMVFPLQFEVLIVDD